MNKEIKQLKQDLENSEHLADLAPELTDEIEDLDDAREFLEQLISETEIIYYATAIEYLADYDSSLTQSLAIASDYGFTPSDLDSEKLAILLMQELMLEELNEILN